MAIIETITDDYHFWWWLKKSDSYKDNFTVDGAKALQEYLEEFSEDTGENIEFDPIAWCVEWSEYASFETWAKEYYGTDDETKWDVGNIPALMDETTVIELDNGGIVIQDF